MRFGKSLWLSVLANYYDVRTAGDHEILFGDLSIGETPTPLAHRYFVMRWDFSKIDPDPPRWGVNAHIDSHHERIGNELRGYLNTMIRVFQRDYEEHLPEILDLIEDPFHNFEELLSVTRKTPYSFYLLIDEYDNFANEVLANDEDAYKELVHTDGPFKYLFKWLKGLMGESGLDRLFVTGVSPMVMSDVTSGLNIAKNVFLGSRLGALCGFTGQEVQALLKQLHGEISEASGDDHTAVPTWTVSEAHAVMRDWYNGYRFTATAAAAGSRRSQLLNTEAVYNPTLVLYFLDHLRLEGVYPDQMLDANLAADEGKLDYLARVASGKDAIIDLIRLERPLEIRVLRDRFTLRTLLEQSAQDASFIGAYLFYFGMLTLRPERNDANALELVVPNEVVRGLYVDRIREILMPLGTSRTAADAILFAFLRSGRPQPLLDFIEQTLFPIFSNRDASWANELTVKTIFLTLLWNDASYIMFSEPELEHRYADLCLMRRPDARASSLCDLLFEFKRLRLAKVGMSGEEVKATSRAELMALPEVDEALNEAQTQAVAYRKALLRRHGSALKLRAYAVVAVGFARLVVRPVP